MYYDSRKKYKNMAMIPKSEIKDLCINALESAGLTDNHSIEIIYNHLIQNEMSGKKSHGLLRIKWCVNYIHKHGLPQGDPNLFVDAGAVGIVDGKNNLGLIAAQFAAETAISKAKEYGIALVGARNHFGTTGTMNFYNRLFAENGLIGIAGCNSLAMVSHPNGFDPVIGTNPISFGIPSKTTPCVIDVTTAQWAYGKLLEIYKSGQRLPEDAIIDKNGTPSTNIKDAMDGAMLPMNGYKGFSLGLAIEVLSGALIGAKSGREAVKGSDGIFFITIDPDKFVGRERFENDVEALLQEIKNSRYDTAKITDILIPGERSEQAYKTACSNDKIEVIDEVYKDLKELAS